MLIFAKKNILTTHHSSLITPHSPRQGVNSPLLISFLYTSHIVLNPLAELNQCIFNSANRLIIFGLPACRRPCYRFPVAYIHCYPAFLQPSGDCQSFNLVVCHKYWLVVTGTCIVFALYLNRICAVSLTILQPYFDHISTIHYGRNIDNRWSNYKPWGGAGSLQVRCISYASMVL